MATLFGTSGNDRLTLDEEGLAFGYSGDDHLIGLDGSETLYGGYGVDDLQGGRDYDRL
jgi:Ca2+-binding RTX toxin-like protein